MELLHLRVYVLNIVNRAPSRQYLARNDAFRRILCKKLKLYHLVSAPPCGMCHRSA